MQSKFLSDFQDHAYAQNTDLAKVSTILGFGNLTFSTERYIGNDLGTESGEIQNTQKSDFRLFS